MNLDTARRLVVWAVTLLLLAVGAGCDTLTEETITGSGQIETRTLDLDGFDAVELSHTWFAEIEHGDDFSVVVSADDNVMPVVEVEVRGRTLEVDIERGYRLDDPTLEIRITMPALRRVSASGASHVEIGDFPATTEVGFDVSGVSTLFATVEVDAASLDASGASTIELDGTATELTAEASGASHLRLDDLSTARASLELSGASIADLEVTERLEVDLSGASVVEYRGDPEVVERDVSGGSRVTQR
jgi:hypothetical protein